MVDEKDEMKVKVLFFAHCREIAGSEKMEVELKEGARGRDLLHSLGEKFPKFEELFSFVALAVNEEYVNSDILLKDGDTVSLIPPVSGG